MRGRKPKADAERLGRSLMIRMTAAQRQAIDAVAKSFGLRTSVWARDRLLWLVRIAENRAKAAAILNAPVASP